MLLKRGMIGPLVAALVADLIAIRVMLSSDQTSNFNAIVESSVRAFQSSHIGPNLVPLVVDGKVGPLTRWALDVALGKIATPDIPGVVLPSVATAPPHASQAGWNALQIAKREIASGAHERGSDNAGSDVMRYHAATGASSGDEWCASFVSFCFHEGNPGAMPFTPTSGARDLLSKFKAKGWNYTASLGSAPAPGDIIVWWRDAVSSWKGHIGLIAGYENGIVTTIEGNRGSFPSKVSSYQYTLGQIDKLLGFGRAQP